jgi:hypothetical protein
MEGTNGIDTFGSPLLADVQFEQDGSLKQSGKQNIRFYNKKRLSFRARKDENGNLIMDKKTGLPEKEAFEEMVEMVRVETRGDTNIVDDVADDLKKRQFYRQYKFFREGKIPDGNPIEDFEFIQPPTVMELHMLGIHVLQQVALMSDLECERLKDQSGYEIRDIASQWVRINSPQGQYGKAARLEQDLIQARREIEELKAGAGSKRYAAQPALTAEVAPEPEEKIETIEMTPEQLAKGRRPRKV